MTNRIRKALALQAAPVTSVTSAPVATIGHNKAPRNAAQERATSTDTITVDGLDKLGKLAGSLVAARHNVLLHVKALLGDKPSDDAKAQARRAFIVGWIVARLKIDETSGNRVKIANAIYDSTKNRPEKSDAARVYNAGKSAWSLLLADAGLSNAQTTSNKNKGANERRAPAGDGSGEGEGSTPVPTPASAKTAAEAVAHITQQANLLQMFCNKNAGVIPGTVADAVSRLYTACTLAAKPE